jgi:hypothetical protein
MGVQLPPKLALSGTLDGAIGYSGEKGFQGELAFQDTALTIPDSPPVRFDKATLVVDRGHAHLTPSVVRTASGDEAQIEADYTSEGMFDLTISTQSMNVESLHAQAALAAVPWLEQVRAGKWEPALPSRAAGIRMDRQAVAFRLPDPGARSCQPRGVGFGARPDRRETRAHRSHGR